MWNWLSMSLSIFWDLHLQLGTSSVSGSIFGDHLQCGMSVVAPVWVVKHLLDPCPLCGGDTNIMEGGGDIAHYIVHGGVDFVRIESPLGLGVTDSEATLP